MSWGASKTCLVFQQDMFGISTRSIWYLSKTRLVTSNTCYFSETRLEPSRTCLAPQQDTSWYYFSKTLSISDMGTKIKTFFLANCVESFTLSRCSFLPLMLLSDGARGRLAEYATCTPPLLLPSPYVSPLTYSSLLLILKNFYRT